MDACPGTVIPEGVPTKALLPGHYALTDANATFNTFKGQESSFTTADTAGCSCAQIIALSGLGPLAGKFGCSLQVMQTFMAGLQAAPATIFPGDGAGNGVALSYIDNGDGTITDLNTGFMWEKKTGTAGSVNSAACLTALHDVNSTCTWAQATGDWLDRLNNRCHNDPTVDCASGGNAACAGVGGKCGFAGYRDWELPDIKKLQSTVDYGVAFPGPTIDPAFGPTAGSFHWSSTENVGVSTHAWFVHFGNGFVNTAHKDATFRVRAVRGGP